MISAIHLSAAISIAFLVVVIVFMDWVPTPLNKNLAAMTVRDRMPSSLIHSALGIVFLTANLLGFLWVILAGAVWFSVVLAMAVRNWWIPYFTGTATGEITPEIYAEHYSKNFTILPRLRDHPIVPDVQHSLIHLSVLAACVLSWVSFVLTLYVSA